MHRNQHARLQQYRQIRRRAEKIDAEAFFNLLTGSQWRGQVETLLPAHRERLFPPTETLSMFLA